MALIYCPNCGKQISDKADRCISCGCILRIGSHSQTYGNYSPSQSTRNEPNQGSVDGLGITSLILGILALFAWILPLAGYPITIVGLILGIVSLSRSTNGNATAGVILCSLGLIATVISSIIGAIIWSEIFSGF